MFRCCISFRYNFSTITFIITYATNLIGSDLDFSLQGLIAALCSAIAQTFMNISIKKVREKTGYSGPKAFLGMSIIW